MREAPNDTVRNDDDARAAQTARPPDGGAGSERKARTPNFGPNDSCAIYAHAHIVRRGALSRTHHGDHHERTQNHPRAH